MGKSLDKREHKELKQVPHLVTGKIYIGALNLNIFINDLLFFSAKCEICNFADDNSLYSCGMNLENILSNLTNDKETYMNGLYII